MTEHRLHFEKNSLEGTFRVRCSCGWWIEDADGYDHEKAGEHLGNSKEAAPKVVSLAEVRPNPDCLDIAKALRNIADDVEAGKYDFEPTIAVLVLGQENTRREPDGIVDRFCWQSHGLGNATFFASKGLLAAASSNFEGPR